MMHPVYTPAQLTRWSIFLDMWERALVSGQEVIVMMDANLDFLKWTKTDLPLTDSTVKLRPLIKKLFESIFIHGVVQLVNCPTRFWPGQEPSGLDHAYTNRPEKMSTVVTQFRGGSDHKLLKVTRFSKAAVKGSRYVQKRVFKRFEDTEFVSAVRQLS